MDVYVSIILVSLTVLRLYAVLRALAYYRRLRRLTCDTRAFPGQSKFGGQHQSQAIWSSSLHFQPMISQQPQYQQPSAKKELPLVQEQLPEQLKLPLGQVYHGTDKRVYLTKYETRSPESKANMADSKQTQYKQTIPQSLIDQLQQRQHDVGGPRNEPVMLLPQSAYSTSARAPRVPARAGRGKARPSATSEILLVPEHSRLVLSDPEPECESEPVRAHTLSRIRRSATPVLDPMAVPAGEYKLFEGRHHASANSDTIGRRLLLASESGTRVRASSHKYRLVAARLKHLPRVGMETGSKSLSSGGLVESGNSSPSSSSCNPDDSDAPAARLRPKQTLTGVAGLRESEELLTGSVRGHKVYEVLSSASNAGHRRPSSLVSKCKYYHRY